jgi:hypothetical protein
LGFFKHCVKGFLDFDSLRDLDFWFIDYFRTFDQVFDAAEQCTQVFTLIKISTKILADFLSITVLNLSIPVINTIHLL